MTHSKQLRFAGQVVGTIVMFCSITAMVIFLMVGMTYPALALLVAAIAGFQAAVRS